MNEELKPCPFCGIDLNLKYEYWVCKYPNGASIVKHSCSNMDVDKWNNAYCWKELSALKAKLDEKEVVEIIHPINMDWQKYLKLEQDNKDLQTQLTEAQARYQAAKNAWIEREELLHNHEIEKIIEREYQRLKGKV